MLQDGEKLGEKKEEGGVASTHTSLNARCMMFTTRIQSVEHSNNCNDNSNKQ